MNRSQFFRLKLSPSGLLIAAGTLVCIATIFGFLCRYHWLLDLFSHFRVQYLFALTLLGFMLLIRRHFKIAGIFLVMATVNFATVVPLYLSDQSTTSEALVSNRAILINVNTKLGDPKRVRELIEEENPDIIVLEEIDTKWVNDLQWLNMSYPYSLVKRREDNFGIGLFSNRFIINAEVVYIGDVNVPSIIATIDTGHGKLRIIATHTHPPVSATYTKLRNEQLEQLPNYVSPSASIVIIGDLNVTPWNYYFKRLLHRASLFDSSSGHGIQSTWPTHTSLLLIPIGHFLHSQNVLVVNKRIGNDVGSDHFPVIVDFILSEINPGKGRQKAGDELEKPNRRIKE